MTPLLPDRPEFLDRIDPWLEAKLADEPKSNAQLIRTWTRWTLLRRARRRLSRRPFTDAAAHYQRSCLTAAIRLLAWHDQQHLTLATLAQADIDRWLTEHPHEYAYLAKEFLRWAHNRHLVGNVVITQRPHSHNPATLSEAEHWQHLHRCLHDDTLPIDVRAAASLLLDTAAVLPHVAGSPDLGVLRRLRPARRVQQTVCLSRRVGWLPTARSRNRAVPVFTAGSLTEGGTRLCPRGIATATPQTFTVASLRR